MKTLEQKAKAYDEALERARMLNNGKDVDIEAGTTTCEYIFPELKESEDERTRKAILGLVYLGGIEPILTKCSVTRSDILAYLEKQKINTEGDFGRGYNCGYKACLHSHGAEFFEKQKEQKPEEWSEEDELMRKRCIADLGYLTEYEPQYKERYDAQIDWLKSLKDRGNFPKSNTNSPSEWSEEDERKRDGIIQWLRNHQKLFNPKYDSLSIESIDSLIDWFKSIHHGQNKSGDSTRKGGK